MQMSMNKVKGAIYITMIQYKVNTVHGENEKYKNRRCII